MGSDPRNPFKVLLVSDNCDLVEVLAFVLERAGFMAIPGADPPTPHSQKLRPPGPDCTW